jgi:hypothetical protein
MNRKKRAEARRQLFFMKHRRKSAVRVFLLLFRSVFPLGSVAAAVFLSTGEAPEALVAVHTAEGAEEKQRQQSLKETAAVGAVNVSVSANGTLHLARTF